MTTPPKSPPSPPSQNNSGVPTVDGADPYQREEQTFPTLKESHLDRIQSFCAKETVKDGALLFERGQRSVDFFIILSGAVEIFDTDDQGNANVFTVHRKNQFTGELDLFNDREILVSGRASGVTEVLRFKRADFRRMVVAEPDIGEIIMRAFILRRVGLIQHIQGGVTVIGRKQDALTLQIDRFLTRNGYPHRMLDIDEDEDSASAMEGFSIDRGDLPVVILPDGQLVKAPTDKELADALGLTEELRPDHLYDLAVIGAGPSGLAAAVYGASEGLETIIVEKLAPGGQAGTSSKIENYLGFPTGISGQALAGRAQIQAQKFGAKLAISRNATGLDCDGDYNKIILEGDEAICARALVIATGASYRKLNLENDEKFEGQGIHYAATPMEAKLCQNEEVAVIGGGNSAGQAAMFLSQTAKHVHLLIRSNSLAASMSSYLIDRLEASPKVTIRFGTAITELIGENHLESLRWKGPEGIEDRDIRNVFVMIGAVPNTGWIGDCLQLDGCGFIRTGSDCKGEPTDSPYMTSRAGVVAVGDVRSGSVKRVASGVGEGSVVIQAVHKYLSDQKEAEMQRAEAQTEMA
ncbi:FAD-dependent oxidoreductase [Parasphingorhabdus litoris]|uniref:Thioredoxin reductase n=1 Tax=Parasphingorhabdus litoris TaxID=394733 RepID=A0ABN1A9K4_9SPHN|nr:FAD-dependent oxidoreductase [Parasphingorhabdus litoris]